MNQDIKIRVASPSDAEALVQIYAPYVKNTAVTFEYEVPAVAEFADRIRRVLEKYPYLVAEENGRIIGYAYASNFHTRAAFAWAVEVSIYLDEGHRRNGVGRRLYGELETILKKQGIRNLAASIACTEGEDPHLTRDSIVFHEKMGYTPVGRHHKCGYKFGRWYDLMWMEKYLNPHETVTAPPIPFSKLQIK